MYLGDSRETREFAREFIERRKKRKEKTAVPISGFAQVSIPRPVFQSKVPKLFGRISDELILFVSSKRMRLSRVTKPCSYFNHCFFYNTWIDQAVQNKRVVVYGTFGKRAPVLLEITAEWRLVRPVIGWKILFFFFGSKIVHHFFHQWQAKPNKSSFACLHIFCGELLVLQFIFTTHTKEWVCSSKWEPESLMPSV